MRNAIVLLAVTLAGCGLSEQKFYEKYQEKGCEELSVCNPNAVCPEITEDAACEYNQDKAKQCLDGEFTCQEFTDDQGNTFKTVVPPKECTQVCAG